MGRCGRRDGDLAAAGNLVVRAGIGGLAVGGRWGLGVFGGIGEVELIAAAPE
jgi:hypothetical protein